MKDLLRCLHEHPELLLESLAATWDVRLPSGDAMAQAAALSEAMLAPGALERAVEALSAPAREALRVLVTEGGALAASRLSGYGVLRRFGPVRLAREQPWRHPESPLEELYYRGLLYRAYGSTEAQLGEILLVPDQLLAPLATLLGSSWAPLVPGAEAPARQALASDALVEDLFAALVHIRMGRVSASEPAEEEGRSAPWLRGRDLDLGPRLRGDATPERLDLLRRILWRLGLVRRGRRGVLQPSLKAREWLRLDDARRARAAYLAWRDDPARDDLRLLDDLRVERGPRPDLVAARQALCAFLADCQVGEWLEVEGLLEALQRIRPDYLRAAGAADGWYVRDLASGEYIASQALWGRLDGALARHLLTHALHWLGAIDLGYDAEGRVLAVRLTERGARLLAAPGSQEAPPEEREAAARAVVGEDLTVRIPVAGTMYDRYQLERFAAWEQQDEQALYRITAESVWHSQDADVRVHQILAFLRRISGDQVPDAVQRTLQAWAGRFGRAALRRVLLLETVDEGTMNQIMARPALRPLLGERLGPRRCLVDEEQAGELVTRLREMGIWPQRVALPAPSRRAAR